MKPITDPLELHKVEMWLVQLKVWLECEAETQPRDVKENYENQAKEIKAYLDSRD